MKKIKLYEFTENEEYIYLLNEKEIKKIKANYPLKILCIYNAFEKENRIKYCGCIMSASIKKIKIGGAIPNTQIPQNLAINGLYFPFGSFIAIDESDINKEEINEIGLIIEE